jgi:hypothetical protein
MRGSTRAADRAHAHHRAGGVGRIRAAGRDAGEPDRFGSSHITVRQKARAGMLLDVMAVAAVVLLVMLLPVVLWG